MSTKPFSVIIPAAGTGRRTGFETPKQWMEIDGEPMVVHVLRIFERIPNVRCVALALNPSEFEERRAQIESYNFEMKIIFIEGGKRRQDTVWNALEALKPEEREVVVIHDAARPFCTRELILKVVDRAAKANAAIAAIPVTDTIKEVDRIGYVMHTPRRTFLRRAQTPQAVRAGILKEGLELASVRQIELTDDAIAAEIAGHRVAVVNGEESNFKITTAMDMEIARQQIANGAVRLYKREDSE
jgi:2-C-methyl-D-erythritol 4-phosphate cytidylyltransferase